MGHARPILVYLCSFQTQILQKNTVGFGGIQIRIIGVEGEHADHLTTTKARMHFCYPFHSLRTVYLFLYQSLFWTDFVALSCRRALIFFFLLHRQMIAEAKCFAPVPLLSTVLYFVERKVIMGSNPVREVLEFWCWPKFETWARLLMLTLMMMMMFFLWKKFLFWIEIKIDFWERESGRKIGSSLGKQWNKIDRKKFNWNQSGQIGGQLNSDPFLYGVWVLYGRTYFEWRK